MRGSGFCPPEIEAVRGSLVEAAFEGGETNGSTISQSGGEAERRGSQGPYPGPESLLDSEFSASQGFELCPKSGTDLKSSPK